MPLWCPASDPARPGGSSLLLEPSCTFENTVTSAVPSTTGAAVQVACGAVRPRDWVGPGKESGRGLDERDMQRLCSVASFLTDPW